MAPTGPTISTAEIHLTKTDSEGMNDAPSVVNTVDELSTDEGGPGTKADPPPPPKPALPGSRRAIVVSSIFLTLFLPALDQTIVSTALPSIMASLGATSSQDYGYTWIGAAYAIASAVVMPLLGQASGILGRKRVFLAAILVFMAGSALCGGSVSVAMLIAARTVQGVGAGGILALVMILIGDLVSTRDRGKYQGLIGATWAVASALGPVLSGFLSQSGRWRWCFLLNLPICTLCLAINFLYLNTSPPPPAPSKGPPRGLRSLDWLGIASLASAAVLLLLALDWAARGSPWASPPVLACLVATIPLLATFAVAEARAARPVLPLALVLGHPTRAAAYAAALLHAAAYMGLNYYLPVYFQAVRAQGAAETGVGMLPFVVMCGTASAAAGYAITKTRRYQELIWASFVLSTVGCGLLTMLDQNTSTGVTVVLLLVVGTGVATNFNSLLIPIHASFDETASNDSIAMSASAYSFLRTFGMALGISISGLVCFGRFQHARGLDATDGASIPRIIEELGTMGEPERTETRALLASVMRAVFVQITVVMGLATLASFFIQRHQLGDKVRSDHKITLSQRGASDRPSSSSSSV